MKKILIAITSVALLTAVVSSCSKKIDEAYANPNADVPENLSRTSFSVTA